MRLYIKFIRGKKLLISVLGLVSVTCIMALAVQNLAPRVLATQQLDEDTITFYALNDIFFYDPSCIVEGSSDLCGNTAKEIYWSALSKYFDDPIHVAGIMGNLAYEGAFNPVSWECYKAINGSGNFVKSEGFNYYYNYDGTIGVGAFGITSGLNKYLHSVNEDVPELLKYFSNPSEYSYSYCYSKGGYDTYGDELLAKIGTEEYGKLVEYEVNYAIKKFNTTRTETYRNTTFATPADAAANWAVKWEVCGNCKSGTDEVDNRGVAAEKIYEEFKNWTCSSEGIRKNVTVSDVVDTDITLIGDSISVYATAELQEKFPSSVLSKVGSRSAIGGVYCGDTGAWNTFNTLLVGSGNISNQDSSGACNTITVDSSSLKDNIVWEIGTNNPVMISITDIENMIKKIGSRNLFLVAPYKDGLYHDEIDKVAEDYRKIAEQYDNVYVVDWNKAVRDNKTEYILDESGFWAHPNEKGRQLLADLIAEAVGGAAGCAKDSYKDQSYQGRLSNLHDFNQNVGTFKDVMMCSAEGSNTIAKGGCGIMSLYAAYYMFTGKGLNDSTAFEGLLKAAEQDHYNACTASAATSFGENLANYTGLNSNGSVRYDWDTLASELKKGNKILILVSASNGSAFTSGGHYMMLDHYDESKNMIYMFDSAMWERPSVSNYVRDGHVEYYTSDGKDGMYIDKVALDEIVKPVEAVSIGYDGGVDCYNICKSESGNSATTPIYPLDEDSVDIACARGTKDAGIYDHAHYRGSQISIRLCEIEDTSGNTFKVNSRVSGAFYGLIQRAKSSGVSLTVSSSFRTYEEQTHLYYCYTSGSCNNGNLAASPGNSNHESGYAVDFGGCCLKNIAPTSCHTVASDFLRDNIADFGLVRNVASESWHVDPPSTPLNGENN